MIHLFSSYFDSGNSDRQIEIDYCLARNVANPNIDRIILFVESKAKLPITSPKISIIETKERVNYADWLIQTKKLPGSAISVLANSDIYFDHTLPRIEKTLSAKRSFLALSRWDWTEQGYELHRSPNWSQDVWALRNAPDLTAEFCRKFDFPMGVPRCDNKVAYKFGISGWNIYNPCKLVRCYHVHRSEIRSYDKSRDDRLIGGVAYVHPTPLLSKPSKLDIDVWVKKSENIGAIALNRSLENHKPIDKSIDGTENSEKAPAQNFAHKFPLGYEIKRSNSYLTLRRGFGTSPILHAETGSAVQFLPVQEKSVLLVPPVLTAHLDDISERPTSESDVNFWQYPCTTEKQALDNHRNLPFGYNIDFDNRIANTYVALPWASYIDNGEFPAETLNSVKTHLSVLQDICRKSNYKLHSHSICQSIHWDKAVVRCSKIGISHLHLSHNERGVQRQVRKSGASTGIFSWPLIAPNIEVESRRQGIHVGKQIEQKAYLASFVGAHMGHYRSDIRAQIAQFFSKNRHADVLVELHGEWHFEKVVFGEQVAGRTLTPTQVDKQQGSALRYNQVLSDSVFSLCPDGSGPNTLRFWESLAVGSIPVLFDNALIFPTHSENPNWLKSCTVDASKVPLNELVNHLNSIDNSHRESMQRNAIAAYAYFRRLRCF